VNSLNCQLAMDSLMEEEEEPSFLKPSSAKTSKGFRGGVRSLAANMVSYNLKKLFSNAEKKIKVIK